MTAGAQGRRRWASIASVLCAGLWLTVAPAAQGQSVPGGGTGSGTRAPAPTRTPGGTTTPRPDGSPSGAPLAPIPLPVPDLVEREAAWRSGRPEVVLLTTSVKEARALEDETDDLDWTLMSRLPLPALGRVLSVFALPRGADPAAAAATLRARHPELAVGPNQRFELLGDEAAPARWGPALVAGDSPDPTCGRGVAIGVLDTGVDRGHPALERADVTAFRLVPVTHRVARADHGTAVAALLVGGAGEPAFAGLVPGARLFVAEIFAAPRGDTPETSTEWIALGLNWVVGRGASVVNLSFGGSADEVVAAVAAAAQARGVALVAAAGNDGPAAPAVYPAALPGVIAATAVDVRGAIWERASQGDWVDLAAPGVDVWVAADGDGAYRSGTSYAAPFVTAAVASEIASGPEAERASADPLDAEGSTPWARVLARAVDAGLPGRDPVYGAGVVRISERCRGPREAATP